MQVLPVTAADAPTLALIHRRAFGPGPKFCSLFSSCSTTALDEHMVMRVNLYLSLPDKRLLKAVDEDGRIAGWTWWDVPCEEEVVMPRRTFPVGTKVELAEKLFEEMRVNALGIMPCYALEILAVDPDFQRRGVGKALVDWGLAKAAAEGLECHLDATPGGVPFYRSIGFVPRGSPIVAADSSFSIIPMVQRPLPPALASTG